MTPGIILTSLFFFVLAIQVLKAPSDPFEDSFFYAFFYFLFWLAAGACLFVGVIMVGWLRGLLS